MKAVLNKKIAVNPPHYYWWGYLSANGCPLGLRWLRVGDCGHAKGVCRRKSWAL